MSADIGLKEAFFTVCNDAKPRGVNYVSLYIRTPFYGGPEEGGWWGEDVTLVAYREFPSKRHARAAVESVKKLAEELNEAAKREFGEHCLRQMEWLDARGLDADYLPEVDGEVSYFVTLEREVGASESHGCRQYC